MLAMRYEKPSLWTYKRPLSHAAEAMVDQTPEALTGSSNWSTQ
jgi:hypothetical protein